MTKSSSFFPAPIFSVVCKSVMLPAGVGVDSGSGSGEKREQITD